MAKRRVKKRTHIGAKNPATPTAINGHANMRDPKSMVIRIGAGEVGSSVSQLAADVRRVMEPGTASRLKERKANRLRDYVTMSGPLGVTHLLLFSRSTSGNTNLRLAVTPRGPTFHFKVDKYSLSKDVRKAQRHPRGGGKEYVTPPLVSFPSGAGGRSPNKRKIWLTHARPQLVMNNFSSSSSDSASKVPKHLESLTTTAFQSLFPPINPQATPLKSIQRVLLLNREDAEEEDGSFILNFRHYAITTKAVGLSKPLKRLNAAEKLVNSKKGKKGGLPNLGKLQDISDYIIGGENGEGYMTDGGTSGSELDTDAEVEVVETVTKRVLNSKARAAAAAAAAARDDDTEMGPQADESVERRAVKMVELGPRMKLRLVKVQEGLCSGKIKWQEYIHKTREEIRELEKKWDQKRKEKEARRKEQKENVERKRKAKAADKKSGKAQEGGQGDEMDVDDEVDSDFYDYEDPLDGDLFQDDAKQDGGDDEENDDWEDDEDQPAGGG